MALWRMEEPVKHFFADELRKEAEITGAQFLVKFLEQKGVVQVYGIPGVATQPFYEAVFEQKYMRSINVGHEQTAIFMADGYARLTGKVGICSVNFGSEADDFLSGLNNAYMDSVPLIALTAQVPTNKTGKNTFQEPSIVERARLVTKAAYRVSNTADLPKVMIEAWKLATQGGKGPVLIDIPVNVQKGVLNINLEDYWTEVMAENVDLEQVTESKLEQVFTMIKEAERPVLVVGGGVDQGYSTEELIDLAQLLQIPVVSSRMGKDGFPNYHRLYAGMVGETCNTPLGTKTLLESDLIVNLGARLDKLNTEKMNLLKEGRKIIHVNIDEKERWLDVPIEWVISSDVKHFVLALNTYIRSQHYKPTPEALERIESLQIERTRLSRRRDLETNRLKPQQAIVKVRKGLRPDAIVTLDSGLSQLWATQLYEAHEPRRFLINGCKDATGWGLGAAMGAQLAHPDRQVVNILGDGSLSMGLEELATARKHNIPVVVIAFRKGLDFVTKAKGMGVEAELVEKPEQITDALTRAFSAYRPYYIEILVDSDAQCKASIDRTKSGIREVS